MWGRGAVRATGVGFLAVGLISGLTACEAVEIEQNVVSYCAVLTDSVGLYVGNPVTQMGFPIGTVQSISPSPTSVQVDFSLTEDRRLPADVRAVVRSTSILADRALELVGNYDSGPALSPGRCVPLDRTMTPRSLSEVIGAANTFVNGINPETSSNIGDVIQQLDAAVADNGGDVNQILTVSSRLVDNPDAAISDMASIVGYLGSLTDTLVALRDPMKQILHDAAITTPYVVDAIDGGQLMAEPLPKVITMISDLEIHAGDEIQLTLDSVADAMRIMTPHARGLASLLDPLPWWINGATNHFNNREFVMSFRPPLYRIRLPNGPAVCHFMNLSMPGSCANVAGQPYGVDINLLQYVFLNASQR